MLQFLIRIKLLLPPPHRHLDLDLLLLLKENQQARQNQQKKSIREQANQKIEGVANNFSALKITEEDIARKEALLEKKEREISEMEHKVEEARRNGTFDQLQYHPKNFPFSFLKIWSYYPEDDIPEETFQLLNKVKWAIFLADLATLINFVSCIIAMGSNIESPTANLVFSIAYGILLILGSIEYVFFGLYKALNLGTGTKFFGFLFLYGVFLLIHAYMTIGAGGYFTGSTGYIKMADIFEGSSVPGIFSLIYSILDTLACVGMGFTWFWCVRYYRSEGLVEKAKREAGKMALDYAVYHKEVIIEAAKENPDLVKKGAEYAMENQ